MKTQLNNISKLVAFSLMFAATVLSQNITNTLGPGGVFKIKDGASDYLTLSQSTGEVNILRTLRLENTTDSTIGVLNKGTDRFIHNYYPSTSYNTFMGINTGNFTLTTANANTGIGYSSLFSLTTGDQNTALGYFSLSFNTSGASNTATGSYSLAYNTTGTSNSAFGYGSLAANTSGNFNTAQGYAALFKNTLGDHNTANGSHSLFENTTGSNNTASGSQALRQNISGEYNTAVGTKALYSNNLSSYNTAMGAHALYSNTGGMDNTAIGYLSLEQNTAGNGNTSLGSLALYNNSTGSGNIGIGYNANLNNQTGSFNTIIGYEAGHGNVPHNKSGNVFIGYQSGYNETNDNRLYIENSISDTPLIWGNFNTDRVVINGNGTHGNQNYEFYVNGDAGGNTAWNSLSDQKLKKNISTISNALEKVKNLRGVNYEWKDAKKQPEGMQIGFIAQEVNDVIPEVVNDSGEYYSMQYAPITALLVEAVKEQESTILTQASSIQHLESRIKELEEQVEEIKTLKAELKEQIKILKANNNSEEIKFSSIINERTEK